MREMTNDRTGAKWNREETILAFDLYCRTPFGKISSSNPDIIELASFLGRTPGSVGLKMHNLAHFDPELQKRNITAMSHGSKLDEEIFTEFCHDWTELSYQAQVIKAKLQNKQLESLIEMDDIVSLPPGEYREQMMKSRVGQYFFRMAVLSSYGNQCCVTGLKRPELLIASHIKPWSVCDVHTERTNPSNGLCLNALHDRAFDLGFITLSFDYKIKVSEQMKSVGMDANTKDWFYKYNDKKISLPDKFKPAKKFIEYHQDVVFRP